MFVSIEALYIYESDNYLIKMQFIVHPDVKYRRGYNTMNDRAKSAHTVMINGAQRRSSGNFEDMIYSCEGFVRPMFSDLTSFDVVGPTVRPISDCRTETTHQSMVISNVVKKEYEDAMRNDSLNWTNSSSDLTSTDLMTRTVHPALAIAILKDRLAKRDIDIRNMFPVECFQFQGRIFPHNLLKAMKLVGLSLSDQGFSRLWKRFDRHNVGTIATSHFFKEFNLDMTGRPISENQHQYPLIIHKTTSGEQGRRRLSLQSNNTQTSQLLAKTCETKKVSFLVQSSKEQQSSKSSAVTIPLDVAELQQALLAGFKLYDFANDGVISVQNFAHVLQEFNINVPSSVRDLIASQTTEIQGICYREYLLQCKPQLKFKQIRKGLLSTSQYLQSDRRNKDFSKRQFQSDRAASLDIHCLPDVQARLKMQSKIDDIQGMMLKIKGQVQQQRNYLRTYFQSRDRMGLGHISTSEMKAIMDRMYWNLTEKEKELMCETFELSRDGRFNYESFLENVTASPNIKDCY